MKHATQYPKTQETNLVDELQTALNQAVEEGKTYFAAFRQVSLAWLGYENDPPEIIDGSNDRGFDAYRFGRNEIELFQFKSQDFTKKTNWRTAADKDVLTDLSRIVSFLQSNDLGLEVKNNKLKAFVGKLQATLSSAIPQDEVVIIRINLVALYMGLTPAAQNELDLLIEQFQDLMINGRQVLVEIEYIDVSRMLAESWRKNNTRWVDATGQKADWITFHYNQGANAFISDKHSVITYVRAKDLIDAYRRFGYQIFESNVRCEIAKSKINEAIGSQVRTVKGIDEFRMLNNGITIICDNKKNPSAGKLQVMRPQVVNGLQTITSLNDAYDGLRSEVRGYFDENCFVMTRIYAENSVEDVPKLVRATNNQNKMESRNLRSNDADQISFEKSFAANGWFYERKDFSWNAFQNSDGNWSTLKGFRSADFSVQKSKSGRPRVRRVDNQDIGQHWLCFIGFVNDAAQKRREIFDNDQTYELIFQTRPSQVAYDFLFDKEKLLSASTTTTSTSPSAEALLLSHMIYLFAKENVLTPARLKEKLIADKGYKHLSEEEIDTRLSEDSDYITGLALSSGTFLFIEMCGMILFRSLGSSLYTNGAKFLLEKSDLSCLYRDADSEPIRNAVGSRKIGSNNIFAALWLMFYEIVRDELADSEQWRQSFFLESSKPRIMYRESTRRKILDRAITLDKRAETKSLNYEYSENFDNVGIIKSIRNFASKAK